MQKHGPSYNCKKIIKVGKKQIIQSITVAWDVAHVVEEDKGLPETVRLVNQFANLVVFIVQGGQSIVFASKGTRIRFGQCFNILAYLLETVAENETNQVEVSHCEHIDSAHVKYPDHLDADPWNE